MTASSNKRAIIVGAGPAGLAAAEVLARAGVAVVIHDRMPNPARKFLLAGRGGLNLTHSEPLGDFLARYGAAQSSLETAIRAFTPDDLRAWCEQLGIETFVGSSGRVFPKQMKASPLLRAWLGRLADLGVQLATRSRWTGWNGDAIITQAGIEGGTIYALSSALRDRINAEGHADLVIDLTPNLTAGELARKIASAPSGTSTANRLRRAGISPAAAGLLRERRGGPGLPNDAVELAAIIKACIIPLTGVAPIDRAISVAGGISWSSLNADYSLKADPRTFAAGEMLDWEAPTGGYLLQACFATGRAAAHGMLARLG